MTQAIQGFLSPNDKEPLTEADIMRQELGTLISDLRIFIGQLRKTPEDWDAFNIADVLEDIING